MRKIEERKTNSLLWITVAIFTLEVLGIVGYYWLHDGYNGVTSLTISKFVGLNLWSCLTFGSINAIVAILMLYYLCTNASVKNVLWHVLCLAFLGFFVALSIFPHLPDGGTVAEIHQFFAVAMFIVMLLIGLLSLAISRQKAAIIICTLFAAYSIYFIISYAIKANYFMSNILWFESAYLYAFFAVLLSINHPEK